MIRRTRRDPAWPGGPARGHAGRSCDDGVVLPSAELLNRFAPLRPVAGVPGVIAHQASDVFALWHAWEGESGGEQAPPFWATVWPAATVLARGVLDGTIRVRGRRVLDLGCGGAVAGLAAALAGAVDVEANDIDTVALHVAQRNAGASRVSLRTTAIDYAAAPPPELDVILVADLFYERAVSERLLARLRTAAAAGVEVHVADGGRPFAPRPQGVCLREETVAVDPDVEGVSSRVVRLFRLS